MKFVVLLYKFGIIAPVWLNIILIDSLLLFLSTYLEFKIFQAFCCMNKIAEQFLDQRNRFDSKWLSVTKLI